MLGRHEYAMERFMLQRARMNTQLAGEHRQSGQVIKAQHQDLRARLENARAKIDPSTYSADQLEGLPEPVQRYFRAVLVEGQPLVSASSLEQTGTLNLSKSGARWRPFHATQRIVTQRPGFDWEAQVSLLPGVQARVQDAYVAGVGLLHASLFGLITLAHQQGTRALAHGELMRFLAEAAWYPTALLPSQGVTWEAVDEHSAKATLRDALISASLLFRFGKHGLIDSVHADTRGRSVGRSVVPTPWEGRWNHYERRFNMLIPTRGEVGWLPDGEFKPYWRGRLKKLSYEFAPAA